MTGLSTTSPPGAGGRDGAPQRVALEQHGPYTANLMKVGAMLPETLALLAAWDGQSREVFTRQVVEGNLVGKATRQRLADLLGRVFWRRFPAAGTPGLLAPRLVASSVSSGGRHGTPAGPLDRTPTIGTARPLACPVSAEPGVGN